MVNDRTGIGRGALAEWLIANAGPVIRYRTAREIVGGRVDPTLTDGLPTSRLVRLWLERLDHVRRQHNSGNDCLENVMGKLLELGLHAGIAPLDERMGFVRKWMSDARSTWPADMMRVLDGAIVAWGLARAGYDDENVRWFLSLRLDTICRAIDEIGFDVYTDARVYSDIPGAFRGKPLLKPELTPGGELRLPYVHDLYAFSALPPSMRTAAVNRQVDKIVGYVLDDAYQSLYTGYGILRAGKRKYYGVGWSVHLPKITDIGAGNGLSGCLVQRLELMAHFGAARRHPWVVAARKHLEGFCTERGTYLFPRSYLNERPTGYWVMGAHMGLEENRRSPRAIELESTFRMLRIAKLLDG